MLSQPSSIHQQNDYHYHGQEDYLSTSLPLAQPQSSSMELLTSPFHPNSFDALDFLNDTSMDLFSLESQNEGTSAMNFDSTTDNPIIDDFTMSLFSISPPQQALSSSLDTFPFQFHISSTPTQQQQQQQQLNSLSDTTGMKNCLEVPSYKGHRRKRSSSVPPFFHSVKKRIIQSSFMPPSFDNGDQPYLSNIMQPMPSSTSTPILPTSVLSHQQQQQYGKPLPIQIQRNPVPIHRHPIPVSLDQRQLDEKLLRVDFNDITVAGLKDHLRERNMSVAGRKADLVDRLRNELERIYNPQQQQQQQQQQQKTPVPTASVIESSSPLPPSSPSTASPHTYQKSSPTHITQLAHRLGGLGFQHHPTPPSSGQANNYHSINTIPSPQQQQQEQSSFGFHPTIPQEFRLPVDSIQQQWISDSSIHRFYQP